MTLHIINILMEEKTEEAKKWAIGTDPGGETETEQGRKGSPGASMSCGSRRDPLMPPNLRGFFDVRSSARYICKIKIDLT